MVAYHSARKITKIAMPFAYVQFNALLLVLVRKQALVEILLAVKVLKRRKQKPV